MKLRIQLALLGLACCMILTTGCTEKCAKPNNPFPELQYVLNVDQVDGVFIHSVEWLNAAVGVSADTFRVAVRAVLFDQPGGNKISSGTVSINGRPLSSSSEQVFSLDAEPGSLAPLMQAATWQISGIAGHENFIQEFALRRPAFFNLSQAFGDFRTNSDFFVSMDRGQAVDETYVFICGPDGTITTPVATSNSGSGYTLDAFNTTGVGNGLIQGTSRYVDLVNIDQKRYAIIFQNSVAYHTEIIEGNEPKCED